MEYIYALDAEVCEYLVTLPKRRREPLVKQFQALAANPYQEAEESYLDENGRTIHLLLAGRFVILWWADHAVKEVRVVGLDPI
jgi:hypothetical protein